MEKDKTKVVVDIIMDKLQSKKIMSSMIEFIRQHGNERVLEIQHQTEVDFTVQKEKLIHAEKKRLLNQF